ncbi:right-handed parallel beta-helix repeat-containing protein [Streptomyces rubiginosohelvolus]|uniref:right-handed parallel beta-helix repeat-containing protein n=1 Tax=Streptomyces rubiginosohelvolus TaxID=67362 RepID=UPI0036D8BBED
MKRTRICALSAVMFGSAIPIGMIGAGTAQADSTTYYVSPSGADDNAGTSASAPFRTLQKAADVTKPGDTVSIMNGTYTERSGGSDVVVISRSGRAGAPITFRAHPGHHPVINPIAAWNGIRVDGASHITLQGLEIKGNNQAIPLADAERGASTKNAKYNTNCVSIEKNRSTGAGPHHINVSGNTVHHCAGGGISAMDADYVTIDRNHVYSTSWYSVYATSGISVLAARDTDGGDGGKAYKIRITNNRVHDNETKVKWERCKCYSDGNGIIVDTLKDKAKANEEGPDYQGRVLVAGNVSYNNGGSGIHAYKSQHVDIVNNTAYQNGRSNRMDGYGNIYAIDSRDVRVLNNISYGRPGQMTTSTHRNVDVTYDYNVYFGGKAPEVKGPNDIVADPEFTQPGTDAKANFRLRAGSPAIDSGKPFTAVATHVAKATGEGDAPDRGAYPHTADSAGADAGSTAPSPENNAPKDSDAESADSSGESPAAGTAAQDGDEAATGNDVQAAGDSEPLADTGGSVAGPLGIGAAGLMLGAGILFVVRRKRS